MADANDQILACKTNDAELSDSPTFYYTRGELVAYLNAKPTNAVVVEHQNGNIGYLFCGAGETADNYYWGFFPAEDPGDANGGDLTADAALDEMLKELAC